MNSALHPSIFTVDVGGIPTVAFAAKNAREAQELGKEGWFLDDLQQLRSSGRPLWDGKAPLRIRLAAQGEIERYDEAAGEGSPAGDIILAFLVTLDPAASREVEPGAPPPRER